MIIGLAIGSLIFVLLLRFMLKETNIADTIMFVILQSVCIFFQIIFGLAEERLFHGMAKV